MMEVVSRLPVEPRRSILVVRIGERHMVVGSSEAGFTKLGELDELPAPTTEETEETEETESKLSFREIFQKGRAS